MPLNDVNIKVLIEAGHAKIDVGLTYSNSSSENPIECTFEFPLDDQTVVSRLVAKIDDRTIEAKIKEKEKAK